MEDKIIGVALILVPLGVFSASALFLSEGPLWGLAIGCFLSAVAGVSVLGHAMGW